MKFTFTTLFCGIITLIVVGTVALSSCNDTPVQSVQQPHVAGTEHHPSPTPTSVSLPSMDRYETGMVTPAWSHDAYSDYDTTLHEMKQATDARWVEFPILLEQATSTSTHIDASASQVSPTSLEKGIISAHAHGLRVFVVPLMGVNVQGDWAGSIIPTDITAWFTSYWQALQPYVNASVDAHADQLSIGVELAWLQNNASSTLWKQLITRVSTVYHGKLTYDTDWSNLVASTIPPGWMLDSRFSYIGVDEYISLVDTPEYVDPSLMPQLWEQRVQSILDDFSVNLNKPIIISEIGFRNSTDALYHAWSITSAANKSPIEQSGAFNAVLTDLQDDHHIVGFFPWSWLGAGEMNLKGMQAIKVIKRYYQKM